MLFTTAMPDHLRKFRDIDLFTGCTVRELRRIDKLATTVAIRAGRVLCRQGEPGRECFVLLDGTADVDIDGRHHTLGRGALLGEIALLIPRGRRTATVATITNSTLLAFTKSEFANLMSALPTVAHSILRETSRRLVENTNPE